MNVKILKSCNFSLDGKTIVSLKKGETVDIVNLDEVRKLENHGVATTDLKAKPKSDDKPNSNDDGQNSSQNNSSKGGKKGGKKKQ